GRIARPATPVDPHTPTVAYSANNPSTSPLEGQPAPAAAAPAAPTGSRWSRVRSQAGAKPWLPLTAVGVGGALIGAVVVSAIFLANPVEQNVNNASSSSAAPLRWRPAAGTRCLRRTVGTGWVGSTRGPR
uniref:hypothetical protein n=1 Tax=Williamsia herbipolensis TaxID=1603258 RepID=UPI0005F896CB